MTGIIVDAQRMRITKADWEILLSVLSKICKREINEFHARDFYKGNSPWRELDGEARSEIITSIFEWLKDRKHNITFTGVDKDLFVANKGTDPNLAYFKSIWCLMGLHLILTIQKHFQNEQKHKGNTVFIFDEEEREKVEFAKLINDPPDFVDRYYSRRKKQKQLDQIIDVPYYGDSKDVNLLQIADLAAYLIRRYAEIKENRIPPAYQGEEEKISFWVGKIAALSLPVSTRYLAVGRDECSELFCKYAPESLLSVGR
jgi:hypothetical protein